MVNEKEKHLIHYMILVTGLALICALFFVFRYNYTVQLGLAVGAAVYYIGWGIVHHALENRLTREVFIEYLLYGFVAVLLVFTALNL